MSRLGHPSPHPIRLVILALGSLLLLVFAPPGGSAQESEEFEASFKVPATVNEWWVEVRVTGNREIATVWATVNAGPRTELPKQEWGQYWAKGFFVATGSHVQFVASDASGDEVRSAVFAWPSTVPLPEERAAATSVVLGGLGGPNDFAFAPNGDVWWIEYYTGNVTRYNASAETRSVMFHADPIPNGIERGLVGLALDPAIVENGVFYVFYTVADPNDEEGGTNRLSRIEDGNETVLLTTTAAPMHNGGRILFAPDGSMFVSTGDNNLGDVAQDPRSPLGKIHHLWPDGRPAAGNIAGTVYDLGHRNVYGLAYDEATHRLFATENSHMERDEVNLVEPGNNYGWPLCEGSVAYDFDRLLPLDRPCSDEFTGPIGEFYETGTTAPTGAAVLGGELYWASFNHGHVHRMTEDPATGTWWDEVVAETGGRILDLETDGTYLYYSNWSAILRLEALDEGGGSPRAPAVPPVKEPSGDTPDVTATVAAVALVGAALATLGGRRHRPPR